MPTSPENYNNQDIRIGALSYLNLDLRVNCNYILDSVKSWADHLRRSAVPDETLEWNLLYIETLNNEQSEMFWCDFNYHINSMDWDTQINIVNGELSVGQSGDLEDETDLFVRMILWAFEDDNDMGGHWGFDSQEAREEFIAKFKSATKK